MRIEEPKSSRPKVIAITVILLAAMLIGWYVIKRTMDAPAAAMVMVVENIPIAIDKTSEALAKAADRSAEALKRLAGAINTKTIRTEYTSTGTTLAGARHLQVAQISQVELFERTDRATRLGIRMPDLVVSARAPVEYIYYLDLTGAWEFRLDEKRVHVIAPPLQFNKPAIDASAITYKIEEGSILRDRTAAIDGLKRTITEESIKRAQQNVQIAREAARREAERFVTAFIVRAYGVNEDTPVSVLFRDEIPPQELHR